MRGNDNNMSAMILSFGAMREVLVWDMASLGME